jgi:hypothetical protein
MIGEVIRGYLQLISIFDELLVLWLGYAGFG